MIECKLISNFAENWISTDYVDTYYKFGVARYHRIDSRLYPQQKTATENRKRWTGPYAGSGDKERFSAKHFRFETSLKNKLYVLWGASLCFCGIENYVLPYKSAYYKVIPDYRETCSVFSIQFFSLMLPSSV